MMFVPMKEVVVVGKVSGIVRGLADELRSMPATTPAILCMSYGVSRGKVKQLLQIPTSLHLWHDNDRYIIYIDGRPDLHCFIDTLNICADPCISPT